MRDINRVKIHGVYRSRARRYIILVLTIDKTLFIHLIPSGGAGHAMYDAALDVGNKETAGGYLLYRYLISALDIQCILVIQHSIYTRGFSH